MTDRIPADEHGFSRRAAWTTTLLVSLAFTLSYVDRQVLSLLVTPIKVSLGLSDSRIGLLQGISFSLFYVVAALPLARLADRTSRPRMIGWCIAAWSVMTCACGIAGSFWQLMAARVGVAVGEAGLPPAALTLMADLHDRRGLARATSLFMLAPFVGGGLALLGGGELYAASAHWTLPVLPIIGPLERWQVLFILVGLPGLVLAPLLSFGLAEPRRGQANQPPPPPLRDLVSFMFGNWRVSILFLLAISLMVALLNAIIGWMPTAIMRTHGLDEAAVGIRFGPVYLIAGTAGTLFAGWLVGRAAGEHMLERTLRYMRLGSLLLLPPAALAALASSLMTTLTLISAVVFLISAVVSMGSIPFQLTAPSRLRAQVLAIAALGSALLGTGLGPLVVGLLSDGFARSGATNPLGLALSTVAAMVLPTVAALLSIVLRHIGTPSARGIEPQ